MVVPQQGFAFAARALVELLGEREAMVVGRSRAGAGATGLCFYFTRRMAVWIGRLDALTAEGGAEGRSSACATTRV